MGRFETLDYEAGEDGVAWVTLDRPEVHNAFDARMMRELRTLWRELREDDAVRVVVLTGAGERAFCTGVDRGALGDPELRIGTRGGTPLHFDDPGDWISPKTAGDLWKPVVAAVNGMACGGAFYLLGQVEFIIAAEHATFFDPHTSYGMAAVFESMAMLQRMPLGEVMRMQLMGAHERLSARRAHEIGLVQEVVPASELREAAGRVAATIASQPPLAVQATLRAVWYAQELGYRQALEVAKTLVQVGNDPQSLAEGQASFASGARTPWRLR
ncbi:enoyl-CoA hydratase/isomerase family protein [Streptacidiphilus pinicola]|uniref:Enoyl-CoA hydratase/isomerase family protein n=1 Tax=Streptacidiphilus pinicola TaxID=2219663 RepID=A0A2X0IAS3_9ACTN|nr:enoyl-CoA hydratase/isomerase family protein [Streptacidiphilus pinicola]RAG81617.1 enoyl-CoA hydratase/isomerase family protein [Streptacidiphilus pinicola]